MSHYEDQRVEAIEDLLKALEAEFPDPVDVFEDALVARLGAAPELPSGSVATAASAAH